MAEKPTITMAERNKIIMDLRKQFTEKFVKELTEEHPDWSETKIRGVAEKMAQKHVSETTQWNTDVVEKGKTVYKAGRGEETMIKKEERIAAQTGATTSQTTTKTQIPKKSIKDIISDVFKKKK